MSAKKLLAATIFLITLFVLYTTKAHAVGVTVDPKDPDENASQIKLTFNGLEKNKKYTLCKNNNNNICESSDRIEGQSDNSGTVTFTVCGFSDSHFIKNGACGPSDYFYSGNYKIPLFKDVGGDPNDRLTIAQFTVKHAYPSVSVSSPNGNKPKPGDTITIAVCGSRRPASNSDRNKIDFDIFYPNGKNDHDPADVVISGTCAPNTTFIASDQGTYRLDVTWNEDHFVLWQVEIKVDPTDGSISAAIKDPTAKEGGTGVGEIGKNPCRENPTLAVGSCKTGLGTISTDPEGFVQTILKVAGSIAGAFALILMVVGSIQVLTSSGDPKAVAAGRDRIVAAIAGLLFLLFSVMILRFIGIQLIGLP